jgi:hypothetical protein
MSAILQSRPAPAGTDSSVTAAITVNFDPDPDLPPDKRFSFGGTGVTGNVFRIDDSVTSVSVGVTLTTADGSPATFASPSVAFGLAPPELTAPDPPAPTEDGTAISFALQAPPHFFVPWAFQLSINATIGGTTVNGIPAPIFFISRNAEDPNPPGGENPQQSVDLTYTSGDGSFNIVDSVTLGPTLMLTNTVFPLDVVVTLGGTLGITFPDPEVSPPITWNGGAPTWTQPFPSGFELLSANQMKFTITGGDSGDGSTDARGQGAGFHFIITTPDGIVVSSPDPILVNATIGDGSS